MRAEPTCLRTGAECFACAVERLCHQQDGSVVPKRDETDLFKLVGVGKNGIISCLVSLRRQREHVGIVFPKPSFRPRTVCAACGEPVRPAELTVVGGTQPVRGEPW